MHDMYAHHRVDDLDLDARSQWVGKSTQKSALNYLYKRQALTLATTEGLFCVFLFT